MSPRPPAISLPEMPEEIKAQYPQLAANFDPTYSVPVNILRVLYKATKFNGNQVEITAYDRKHGREWIDKWVSNLELALVKLDEPDIETSDLCVDMDPANVRLPCSALLLLREYVRQFFSAGPEAASYQYGRLVNAVTNRSLTVDRIELPKKVPAGFWTSIYPWHNESLAVSLVLVLTASQQTMLSEFFFRAGPLGGVFPGMKEVKKSPLQSLKMVVEEAKRAAADEERVTVLCVELVDLTVAKLEELGFEVADTYVTFARSFAMGIGPEGVVVWQAGGKNGAYTLEDYCNLDANKVMSDNDSNRFVTDFEKFAVEEVSQLPILAERKPTCGLGPME